MSNRIVPATYRQVIDDVMANIRQDFADFGVDEDVLAELQHKWEQKVVESNVAEFEPAPPQPPPPPQQPLHPVAPSGHVQLNLPGPQRIQPTYPSSSPAPPHYTQVKSEPHDPPYVLPPLAGPGPPPGMHHLLLPGGQRAQQLTPQQVQQVMQMQHHQHFQHLVQQQQAQQQQKPQIAQSPAPPARVPQVDGPSHAPSRGRQNIPQLDGPSSVSSSASSRSSTSPPPPINRPGPSTVAQPASTTSAAPADTEEIGSDLDDDDSEGDADETGAAGAGGDGSGPGDIVYCTYDKVQRVKNKWKCVLKDGIISVGGRDYLFSKCAGEFEW